MERSKALQLTTCYNYFILSHPEVPGIGDWLARRADFTPHKVALVDTLHAGRVITYREWNRAANRTANFLRDELGARRGDRIAILAMNRVEYLDLWFACGKLGAIGQLLNWRLTPPELLSLLNDATPAILVYSAEFAATVNVIRAHAPTVKYFVSLDAPAQGDIAFDKRDTYSDAPPPPVRLSWNDAWVICYTGGTTGLPKGAILTHRSITANALNTVTSWGLTPDDVALLNAPLFHTGGLNVFTAPLVQSGGTTILCRQFDCDQVFDLIRDAGVTVFFGVPTMFLALQQHPRWNDADFSRLKIVISGGAPCPLSVLEKFWERGVAFKTGYGLTEAGPNNFWLPAEDVPRKPGAVGFPLMFVDARIVDEQARECAPNEIGELLLRGPHVCAGYWNRHEETFETSVDGWLHTGDLARRDDEGYYSIVGRKKDMLISGGENVYPAEVEDVLYAHPAVVEAALIAVPDAKWGEVGRAVVVLRQAESISMQELLAFCAMRLARYKIPKSVVFVEALPKTAAGKVDKPALVRLYGAD